MAPSGRPAPIEGKEEIQLYTLGTPNGQKITIFLEEMDAKYDMHVINIMQGDQFTPWFLDISPNNRIPALVDKKGPGGGRFTLFESGAILMYLARKYQRFIPAAGSAAEWQVIEWIYWQMAGLGPMCGQMNHFWRYAPADVPYGKERYANETQRLVNVLETQLKGREYVVDTYTIADMAIYPWVKTAFSNRDMFNLTWPDFPNVTRWMATMAGRPGVARGMTVTPPAPSGPWSAGAAGTPPAPKAAPPPPAAAS